MTFQVELSVAEARQIALSAQGFRQPCRAAQPGPEEIRRLAANLGAVQIDAVNVLVRSHYLPFYSRLGPYDTQLVDRLAYGEHQLIEYWGHSASLLPVELYPAMRWRMDRYAENKHWMAFQARLERERPGYLTAIQREIAERGPLAYTDLADPARREKVPTKYADSSLAWYRWSDGKSALEGLYDSGRLAVADRRAFERRYDLVERVIRADVLAAPALPEDEGQRELVLATIRALGVATVHDVADYFRLPVAAARARLRELRDAGTVHLARVPGWPNETYLDPGAAAAPVWARALLSPFDSLIWTRDRTERFLGFKHLFELYVTAPKRRYGYYVLPLLLGDKIVARVDLKARRELGTLAVLAAYIEPGASAASVSGELALELRDLASWLGLEKLEISERGDLSAELRAACGGAIAG
jgi:uncharacterized protein